MRAAPALHSEEIQQLGRLRRHAEGQLSDLAPVPETLQLETALQTVASDIARWRSVLDQVNAVEAEFDAGTASQDTVNRLNDLGRAALGPTW